MKINKPSTTSYYWFDQDLSILSIGVNWMEVVLNMSRLHDGVPIKGGHPKQASGGYTGRGSKKGRDKLG